MVRYFERGSGAEGSAEDTSVSTSTFDGTLLDGTDTDTQTALQTIDEELRVLSGTTNPNTAPVVTGYFGQTYIFESVNGNVVYKCMSKPTGTTWVAV